jgi:hypothetical protein
MASRTGAPKDAWAIDYKAHSQLLQIAKEAGIAQFVLVANNVGVTKARFKLSIVALYPI